MRPIHVGRQLVLARGEELRFRLVNAHGNVRVLGMGRVRLLADFAQLRELRVGVTPVPVTADEVIEVESRRGDIISGVLANGADGASVATLLYESVRPLHPRDYPMHLRANAIVTQADCGCPAIGLSTTTLDGDYTFTKLGAYDTDGEALRAAQLTCRNLNDWLDFSPVAIARAHAAAEATIYGFGAC